LKLWSNLQSVFMMANLIPSWLGFILKDMWRHKEKMLEHKKSAAVLEVLLHYVNAGF
jgi:hypothetical protein